MKINKQQTMIEIKALPVDLYYTQH